MISGFSDISLGVYGGAINELVGTDELCVYNRDSDLYSVRYTTTTGSAVMTSASSSLAFTLQFEGMSGSPVTLGYDTNSPTFSGANSVSTACNGATNATLRVVIAQNELLRVRPGGFSATVAVTLSPG
jgi:hypothetical protein